MDITSIIDQITTTECAKNCKFGKCLIALKELRDLDQPQGGASVVEAAPTASPESKLQRKTAVSKPTPVSSKPCNSCGNTWPLDQYPKNKGCKDGHAGTCKECTNARLKKSAGLRKKSLSKPGNNITENGHDPAPERFDDEGDELVCKLCKTPAASKERLERHMRLVHNR